MSFDDISDREKRNEAYRVAEAFAHGRLTRRQFVSRSVALGLSVPAIASVLAACGGGDETTSSPSPTEPTSAAETGAADTGATAAPAGSANVAAIVYPDGITSDPGYKGPFGGDQVAFLPADYFDGVDADGVRNWMFTNFKADKSYRLAYAHFSSKWDVSVELSARMQRAAERMGASMALFDNNFDADQALKNAQLIAQQQFDFAIIGQIFPDTNKAIYELLDGVGIPSIYYAVEGADGANAAFLDPGNFRMFSELGEWIGNYVKDNWDGQIDLVIQAAQPRAGAYVGEREVGFVSGLKTILPDIPDSVFTVVDGVGLLEESQKVAADVLTGNPDSVYIVGQGSNDDSAVGIVRAIEAAGRTEFAAVAGQAGQGSAVEELKKPDSPLKVSAFQDVEAVTWAAAIGVLKAMGGEMAPVNFYPFDITTKDNVNEFPPQLGILT